MEENKIIVKNNEITTIPTKVKKLGGITGKGFMPGQSGNRFGRPKGGLKDYDRQRFLAMTDEQKEAFLAKVAPELRYRMAEGNPDTKTEHSGEVKIMPILGGITQKEDE